MTTVRDVAIIILAAESIVVGVLLAILTVQTSKLVRMLRDEIRPVLDATQETVGTVRGTTVFLSEHLVSPIVTVVGYASGLRQAARTLLGLRFGGRGSGES